MYSNNRVNIVHPRRSYMFTGVLVWNLPWNFVHFLSSCMIIKTRGWNHIERNHFWNRNLLKIFEPKQSFYLNINNSGTDIFRFFFYVPIYNKMYNYEWMYTRRRLIIKSKYLNLLFILLSFTGYPRPVVQPTK